MHDHLDGLDTLGLLAPREAARYLGIGKTKLYEELKKGRLQAKRSGGQTLIMRAELERWANALPDHRPADTVTSARMKLVRRQHRGRRG